MNKNPTPAVPEQILIDHLPHEESPEGDKIDFGPQHGDFRVETDDVEE